ncbi:putative pal1-like protein [Erysiphe neolycopersici]|uniref:Putative pal1-like protein n=1 Tax=Erysiphe neolycopersici TaxID=212602 RepID=A0A420HIN2_9PEZI|nr:putative pal1-like protein [Erysiphe neolycopersici]
MSVGDLARRSLHLKLYPNPTTFAHRREVLRIISNYGEVNMFRSLKYHPISPTGNAFAVIFGTEASAQAALNASPIRYRILMSDKISSTTTADANAAAATSTTMTPDVGEIQEFALHISPTSFCHEKFIMSRFTNPLHGPFFPIHPHLSLIGSSLMQYIKSNSLAGPGLLDWDTDRGRGIPRVRNTRLSETPGTMFKALMEKTTDDRQSMLEQENDIHAKSSP